MVEKHYIYFVDNSLLFLVWHWIVC